MCLGLGRIEIAVLALLEHGEDGARDAEGLADEIYRPAATDDGWRVTRAQRLSVLRAVHSLARKYPGRIEFSGGRGRARLRVSFPRKEECAPISKRRFDARALIG